MSQAIDRICNLPKDVTEAIFMHLPLRDVVRTSILSRYWRYEWNTLPKLVFDESCVSHPEGKEHIGHDTKLVEIVNQVLFLHHGPIRKFKLEIIMDELDSCGDIDRWIVFLSRNGIKEFTFKTWDSVLYKMSSCLYLCEELTHLGLTGCAITLPASFKGFCNLTTLSLSFVDFPNNGLETLICLCPLLTKSVLEFVDCDHLNIRALKLVELKIDGEFEDYYFENTPLLAILSINVRFCEDRVFSDGGKFRLTQLFGSMPRIERLELSGSTFPILLRGNVPLKLPTACQLKYLSVDLNSEDMQEMSAMLCIFRSSPILQELRITTFGVPKDDICVTNFWEAHKDFNCLFSRLRTVEVTNFKGTRSELKLVEFVLANAPVLEMVQIELYNELVDELNILREMIYFQRVSSKARIVFPRALNLCK